MPIVKESNPLVKRPPDPERNAEIAPKEYRHSVVVSKKTPLDGILTHISGMRWVVDYYSQILSPGEEPKAYGDTTAPAYQSYDMISKYELRLQGELNASFDDAQNRVSMSGSAILYPKLKPNKGDVIVGDIGDGRAGRFSVTEVSQKTIYGSSCYEIGFELVEVMSPKTEALLQNKVVKQGKFVRDFVQYGQNPVLVGEEVILAEKIDKAIKEILSSWLNEFYSYEIGTIRVPWCEKCYVYDPWITTLITKLFTVNDHPLLGKINLYNCDAGVLRNYVSIWDAILSGEAYVLETAFKEYQLVNTQFFNNNVFLRNISTSNIDVVIMPWAVTVDKTDPLFIGRIGIGERFKRDQDVTLYNAAPFKAEGIELPGMVEQRDYVVSCETYELNDKPVSDIEQELRNYFQEENVDVELLLTHVRLRKHMSKLQRFYLMPLCLLMLTHALRSI